MTMAISSALPLLKIISSVEKRIPEFTRITSSPYFSKRLLTREENDSITLTLSLTFLQDMNEPIENLDQRVLDAILESREESGLEESLTDVSVNLLSWRRGV